MRVETRDKSRKKNPQSHGFCHRHLAGVFPGRAGHRSDGSDASINERTLHCIRALTGGSAMIYIMRIAKIRPSLGSSSPSKTSVKPDVRFQDFQRDNIIMSPISGTIPKVTSSTFSSILLASPLYLKAPQRLFIQSCWSSSSLCNATNNLCRPYYSGQQSTSHRRERRCLGQQESVQLCEYVRIFLAIIQTHIDDWRLQHHRDDNWKECLNTFRI